MALTNLFQVFGSSSSNLRNDTDWASNQERLAGFVAGAVANSTNINTAIKSNSLVTVALMDFLCTYGSGTASYGITSTTANIKNLLLNVLQRNFVFEREENIAQGDTIRFSMFGSTASSLSIVNAYKALKDTDGRNITSTYFMDVEADTNDSTAFKFKAGNQNTVGTMAITRSRGLKPLDESNTWSEISVTSSQPSRVIDSIDGHSIYEVMLEFTVGSYTRKVNLGFIHVDWSTSGSYGNNNCSLSPTFTVPQNSGSYDGVFCLAISRYNSIDYFETFKQNNGHLENAALGMAYKIKYRKIQSTN